MLHSRMWSCVDLRDPGKSLNHRGTTVLVVQPWNCCIPGKPTSTLALMRLHRLMLFVSAMLLFSPLKLRLLVVAQVCGSHIPQLWWSHLVTCLRSENGAFLAWFWANDRVQAMFLGLLRVLQPVVLCSSGWQRALRSGQASLRLAQAHPQFRESARPNFCTKLSAKSHRCDLKHGHPHWLTGPGREN